MSRSIRSIVVTLLVAVVAWSSLNSSCCTAVEIYRLPSTVVPTFYNISVKPYLPPSYKEFTFDGEVSIYLHAIVSDVKRIILHKDYINITGCWLYKATGSLVEEITIENLVYVEATDQLTVPLTQSLVVNEEYQLHFTYTGEVRDGKAGVYRVSYEEPDALETKWMIVTQLQRIDARTLMPCFDEPAIKSKFQMHISRPNSYISVSNTKQILSSTDGDDRQWDHFEETPLMSTYLLAFMVFQYSKRGSGNYIVYSRPDYVEKTEFSYSVGENALQAFNKLFQSTYEELGNSIMQFASSPLFPHNGMENWGLIIYSDYVLVQEPGFTDGWEEKELTVRVIVHETSHMWFGNSVTFQWWSYFWLNEAFARYYEYFMCHQLYPEYQLDQQFVVRQQQLIFRLDSRAATQPMTSVEDNILTPSQIASKFSSIAYAKGASIVRMWRNLMGPDNFDAAINSYLKKYHLKSTIPSNLFNELKTFWPNSKDIEILDQFFSDFTEQVGYPMVSVYNTSSNHFLQIEQERFLSNRLDGSDPDLRYTLPITYATNLAPDFETLTPKLYFHKLLDVVRLYFDEPIDWIVLNVKASNYYRVYYDSDMRVALKKALMATNHSNIAVENRAQIIDDFFSFAAMGRMQYEEVFEFLEYLRNETSYIPWYAAYTGMESVAKHLTAPQLRNFRMYLADITAAVFEKLGVYNDEDTVLDVFNRNRQVHWLCKYGDEQCKLSIAMADFKPSVDFRATFYCAASRAGRYEEVLGLYKEATVESEQQKLWKAASCTLNYNNHYNNEILTMTTATTTTVAMKIIGLKQLYQMNPEHVTPVFEMITQDIAKLSEALGSWDETANILSDLADYFTTNEQIMQLEQFIEENHKLFNNSTILVAAAKTAEQNVAWAENHLTGFITYLDNRYNGASLPQLFTLMSLLLPLLITVL